MKIKSIIYAVACTVLALASCDEVDKADRYIEVDTGIVAPPENRRYRASDIGAACRADRRLYRADVCQLSQRRACDRAARRGLPGQGGGCGHTFRYGISVHDWQSGTSDRPWRAVLQGCRQPGPARRPHRPCRRYISARQMDTSRHRAYCACNRRWH